MPLSSSSAPPRLPFLGQVTVDNALQFRVRARSGHMRLVGRRPSTSFARDYREIGRCQTRPKSTSRKRPVLPSHLERETEVSVDTSEVSLSVEVAEAEAGMEVEGGVEMSVVMTASDVEMTMSTSEPPLEREDTAKVGGLSASSPSASVDVKGSHWGSEVVLSWDEPSAWGEAPLPARNGSSRRGASGRWASMGRLSLAPRGQTRA